MKRLWVKPEIIRKELTLEVLYKLKLHLMKIEVELLAPSAPSWAEWMREQIKACEALPLGGEE